MKLISWNIDSLNAALTSDSNRALLTREVLRNILALNPDIIAIQETKLTAKGLTKKHAEGRIITLEFEDLFVTQVYTPNAGNTLGRLEDRQIWDQKYAEYLSQNNREWFHVETAAITFESDGEELQSVDQTYYYRSGFELYDYTFKLTAPKEEYNDQERVALTNERIEEVLGMADFSHEPTKTKEEIHTVLNGTWDAGDSGYLHFNAGELKWYKDSDMQEENVLLIDVTDVVPLIHPENDTEYALLQLDYLTETIDGQTYDSETELTLLINFMDDNNIILADYQTLEYYKLSKVE